MFSNGNDSASPAEPSDSATVILLREDRGSFEVFLMRRHQRQSFMGGAHVFPGGRMDLDDCAPELCSVGDGLSAAEAKRMLQEPELDDGRALGLFFCVLRELFEEAGVLMARDERGHLISFAHQETAGRFSYCRSLLHRGEMSLCEMAEKENLSFAVDLLVPYARWITPEMRDKRFDTRFFMTRLPAGQEAAHDEVELVESTWLTPMEALEQHHDGVIMFMPPTLKTLEELIEFGSIDDVFIAAGTKPIYPVLPQSFSTGRHFGVLLPHDPDYTIDRYKQPTRPGETSRLVMKDGRWMAMKAGGG